MNAKIEALLKPGDRRRLAEGLVLALAGSFTLAVKIQAYGWNVTGPLSATLRPLFTDMQQDLYAAVDEFAIRIKVFGLPAPSAFSQFAILSNVQEEPECPAWRDMVRQLVEDQDVVANACRRAHDTAELFNDKATLDLLSRRIARHERNGWELKTLLE